MNKSDSNLLHNLTIDNVYLSLLQHDLFGAVANTQLCLEELLESQLFTPEQANLLRSIEYSQKKLAVRGKNILDMQRIGANSPPTLLKSTFCINQLILNMQNLFTSEALSRNIIFSFGRGAGGVGGAVICGDFGRVERLLWNVKCFFLRFTDSGGAISFDSVRKGEFTVLEWGASPCLLPLAELRDWLDITLPVAKGGQLKNGDQIAMRVTKELVDQHNGTIELSSNAPTQHLYVKINLPHLIQ